MDRTSYQEEGLLDKLMLDFRNCPHRASAERSEKICEFLPVWEKIHRQFWKAFRLGVSSLPQNHGYLNASDSGQEKDFEKKLVLRFLAKRKGALAALEKELGQSAIQEFDALSKSIVTFDRIFLRIVESERNRIRIELIDTHKRNTAHSAYLQSQQDSL